jgi:glycosyltransferase involved in cell wall biosynthesis
VGDKHLFFGQEDLDYISAQNSDLIDQEKLIYRPTGLILERYPLADPAQVEPYTVGFFGAFDWEANVDAVSYFVEDILPLIQAELPQIKFVLAGRAAPSQVRELAQYPSVEFLGRVEDMFSVAQRVAAIVVPLRIGAGTRLKILEAMAWGKPIVTTSIGVEGVEHVNGEDLIVADTADLFAKATIALLDDPAQQGRLAQAARQRVELFYSTQCSVDRLQAAMAASSPA